MKKFLKIIVALFFAISIFGCEKDDICPDTTPTTPRLIFEFYEFNNPNVLRSVSNLKVFVNDTESVVLNESSTATDSTKFIATGTKIALPLDFNSNETTFKLRLDDPASSDPLVFFDDDMTISYNSEQIYVSRACGFKTNFDIININQTDAVEDRWIKNLIIELPNVQTENEIHVKIYF